MKLLVIIISFLLVKEADSQIVKVKNTPLITKVNPTTIKVYEKAVVPGNQVFYVFDKTGKNIGTFHEGEEVIIKARRTTGVVPKRKNPGPLNCVMIDCPASFNKGTVCWHCD